MQNVDWSLCLVTDRTLSLGHPLEYVIEQAIKGGVTMVQLREKTCSSKDFYELAMAIKQLLQHYHIPLIINDRLDIAMAVNADGIHIGQSDIPWQVVRRLWGKEKIIGLSVENVQQVIDSNSMNIDYIGLSPVFATPTKTDTAMPLGLEKVKEMASLSKHPTMAIGGINMHNVSQVISCDVSGIAVVSAISSAENPMFAAKQLKNEIDNYKKLKTLNKKI